MTSVSRSWISWIISAVAVISVGIAAAETEQTRDTMNEIFGSMKTLLVVALDPEDWSSEEFAGPVNQALDDLQDRAGELERHGEQAAASFEFYSHILSEGVWSMRSHYRAGSRELARRQLFHLVDTCVGCHSRLPATRKSHLAERFASDERIRDLPLDERVRLEVATRQFDAAMATYEEMIASGDYAPSDLDRMGILDDYLTLCFQVRSDVTRPRSSLEALLARPDVSESLADDVRGWLKDIDQLPNLTAPPSLSEARRLSERARGDGSARSERSGLVDYLAASAMLYRVVEETTRPAKERAEAYYLLAVVESQVGRAYWPAPEEVYLESAIRLAPGTETSANAFVLLRDLVELGYTGSGGTRIPESVKERLEVLRALATPKTSTSGV